MKDGKRDFIVSRRELLKGLAGGTMLALLNPLGEMARAAAYSNLFWIRRVPSRPFVAGGNRHVGVDNLLDLMGRNGLKFYRSDFRGVSQGPRGMIAPEDVVLIKVNAQWKYRGATNSDLVRGIIQAVLDHPDGFTGEVVVIENGQGRGSLGCDTSKAYGGDTGVQANALNRAHSFTYVVENIFRDPRVSGRLLDPIRTTFIEAEDHATDGYRRWSNVSYPCFTTAGGRRVELREGVWDGSAHQPNLKLINVPVLKHHDRGGSEITGALKHFYGILSMSDGYSTFRHYGGLGQTSGRMMARVRPPVLNIMDAIWVSHRSLRGYPPSDTFPAGQILAGQDPVAVDFWAAKYILYSYDRDPRHHPLFAGIRRWLASAADTINSLGGLYRPEMGLFQGPVTWYEDRMRVYQRRLS